MYINVDSDVRRKVAHKQPRIDGQFFKSGCSIEPAYPPKVKEGKRGYGKRVRGERDMDSGPMRLWRRRMGLGTINPNCNPPAADMAALRRG